jgi:hypothetical protein
LERSGQTVLDCKTSTCLGRHEECSGFYTDDKNQFLLKCACPCHIMRHEEDMINEKGVGASIGTTQKDTPATLQQTVTEYKEQFSYVYH